MFEELVIQYINVSKNDIFIFLLDRRLENIHQVFTKFNKTYYAVT